MPKENAIPLDILKSLYETLAQVRDLAPWQWMEESDLIGLENPDTKAFGFISIMGMAGEHYSVAVYLGAEGLYGFLALEQAGPYITPELMLSIPQLQASLEDREQLSAKDRDQIKTLGLKFRGKQAWPQFRSYRPGYAPWYLDEAEARFLLYTLEQVLEVAPRFKTNPALLRNIKRGQFLVRTSRKEKKQVVWDDKIMPIAPPEPKLISITLNPQVMKQVQQARPVANVLEVDCFMMPSPVQDGKDSRPYFPYMLMIVEGQSGYIFHTDLLSPVPDITGMWSAIPGRLLSTLKQLNVLPQVIHVRTPFMAQILAPLADKLGIQVKQSRRLPALDQARNEFERFMPG
jgi:hypothetical protein